MSVLPKTLSREEEAELARSNKKVKNYHHADFNVGTWEEPGMHRDPGPNLQGKKSFRDKLVGEIPGAFAEAFDLSDHMEEDPDSDDDEGDVEYSARVGVVTMKLSKETKRRIRGPWSKAIIVKLVGRTIGFSYLQSKLSQLWKPSGRMDCVDLTYGFFLVKFYSKEDLDNVIKKGPWFIGDHFLSFRAWEPFFKPSAASVSQIAVWIRLNELPIELYEPEVLKQIGENIGKVLRIDSHTAMEARGKYARLCIQIDLNKPLINTVIIGRFEQAVAYEGIHRLCFSCGRVGHKIYGCPYTIREGLNPLAATEKGQEIHDDQDAGCTSGGGSTPNVCEEKDAEGQYGPWMVVRRKRHGFKGANSGKKTEGTSTRSRTSPLPPGPKISGRTSTSMDGPTFRQSVPRGELYHSSEGPKFKGPSTSRNADLNDFTHDGPLKFTAAGSPSRLGCPVKSKTETGSLAHYQKPFSHSVKGKKIIARGFASLAKISAAGTGAQPSEISMRSAQLPQSSPNAFEFSASTKADFVLCTRKGELSELNDGILVARSEGHPWGGSDQAPTLGDLEAKTHHPSNGVSSLVQIRSRPQTHAACSNPKDGRCEAEFATGLEEDSRNDTVDGDSMDSEEGGASASP